MNPTRFIAAVIFTGALLAGCGTSSLTASVVTAEKLARWVATNGAAYEGNISAIQHEAHLLSVDARAGNRNAAIRDCQLISNAAKGGLRLPAPPLASLAAKLGAAYAFFKVGANDCVAALRQNNTQLVNLGLAKISQGKTQFLNAAAPLRLGGHP